MAVEDRIYTYDDLAATPDDGKRYEIVYGVLHTTPVPPTAHQRALGRLIVPLTIHVEQGKLGQVYTLVDVLLSPHNVVVPDITVIARERLGILREAYVDGAPDLAVEVLSEDTRRNDLVLKRALYAMSGVPEYWIVDIDERSVTVLRLVGGQYVPAEQGDGVARSRVVPGFAVAVAAIFADLN